MSDSQAYEEVTGTADGVTVVKRFEEDEFPVPAIAFEFSSERDEPVRVTVRDTVPESVAVEDLGFHPEYGSEYWTIDEDEITFERELEAEADYTTVYGIRATGTDDVEKFLTRPEITDVDPPLPEAQAADGGDEVIPESDDDVVRDVISGESDDVPGLDEETDEEIETLDLKDPNDEGQSAESQSSSSTSGTSDDSGSQSADDEDEDASSSSSSEPTDEGAGGESVSVSGDSLVAALATEIRQNNVSAEDVKLLRQAFEIAGQEGGSIQARVERLQSDVADIRAYSDAMEEFLDENGTAQQLIDDFESDLDAVEESVEQMQAAVEDNSEEVSAVSDEVSSLGSDVAEVSGEVDDVSEEVTEVSDEVSSVSGEVADVEDTVADLEETIASLEDSMGDIEDQVTDEDVTGRIEEMEQELDDLQTWQDQIKETFGG